MAMSMTEDEKKELRMKLVIHELGKLYDLPETAIKPEFFDFLKIVSMGAKKYAMDNWLEPEGIKSSHKQMCDSLFHHLSHSTHSPHTLDESGFDPMLLVQCRSAMDYTRRQREIVHPEDK